VSVARFIELYLDRHYSAELGLSGGSRKKYLRVVWPLIIWEATTALTGKLPGNWCNGIWPKQPCTTLYLHNFEKISFKCFCIC